MTKITTVNSCLEALGCYRQRGKELAELHPVTDRLSAHYTSREGLHFALTDGSREWVLTIPRGTNFRSARWRIEARVAESEKHPILSNSRYISEALTLFSSNDEAYTRPALLEEAFLPLEEYVRLNCCSQLRPHLRAAIESIAHAVATLRKEHLHHGELSGHKIHFTPEGNLRLMGYATAIGKGNDSERLAETALLLFVAGCDPNSFRFLITPGDNLQEREQRLNQLLSAAELYAITPMAEMVKLLMRGGSSHSIEQAIVALAGHPFRLMPRLGELLRASSPTTTPPPATELDEEICARVDFDLCDEVTSPTDQIVRYRRDNYWGYAYTDGERIAVERRLTSAGEFAEGRAVVGTERGYGLMDNGGRMVMNDVWAEVVWYPDENIAVATDDKGFWQIYNRMGHQLSAHPADWMGDASEGFVVARRGGKYGYYSTDGHKLSDFIYDDAQPFVNGRALVCFRGRYYHIDTSLHQVSNGIKKEEK